MKTNLIETKIETLTENEAALLVRLHKNRCADSSPFEDPAWTFNVVSTHAEAATLGSLVKKGMVRVSKCPGEDETYRLLETARPFAGVR